MSAPDPLTTEKLDAPASAGAGNKRLNRAKAKGRIRFISPCKIIPV